MKVFFIWMAFVITFSILFNFSSNEPKTTEEISFSQFVHYIQKDEVKSITIKNEGEVFGEYLDSKQSIKFFVTYGDASNPEIFKILLEHNIIPNYEIQKSNKFVQLLISLIPIVLLFFLVMYMMNKTTTNQSKMSMFGQSKAKLVLKSNIKFDDVAGNEEAKEDLQEIVDYLKNPDKYVKMGAKIPKGILMEGPPGVGKSLMAKAVAGEADVSFFVSSGSEFVEMFVGVGASRVRDLFEQAKANSPSIIFIDEIDSIGRKRGNSAFGGHSEVEQTLNQLLTEMDGFTTKTGVIVMAATNRADILDPALVRPGRFDRKVAMSNPDIKSREAILTVHTKGKSIDSSVSLNTIARGTPGFSGADLANLVNEAIILAVRKNKLVVTMDEFETSRDKILMGSERKSLMMTDKDKEVTSIHELGHVLTNKLTPHSDPLHKVTILPRGNALGVTFTLPDRDPISLSKEEANAKLIMLMGGRAAEEIVFGHFTSGASNDIKQATELATKMVCDYGFSEEGPLKLKPGSKIVNKHVSKLVKDAYDSAKLLIEKNKELLLYLSKELYNFETLNNNDIDLLMDSFQSISRGSDV